MNTSQMAMCMDLLTVADNVDKLPMIWQMLN